MRKLKSIQPIHDAISPFQWDYTYDYDFNKSWNKYVSNGKHRPETFEELVWSILVRFIHEYGKEVIDAYWQLCWYEDQFFFPAYEDVKSLLNQ